MSENNAPKKPHALWPGLLILAVLVVLGLLSGGADKDGFLVMGFLVLPPSLGAILAAVIAAYRPTERQVIFTARLVCVLGTLLIAVPAAVVALHWRGQAVTGEFVGMMVVIFTVVGGAVSPFSATHAVYRHARRLGKSHDEAQQASRWDPDRFGE